MGSSRKAIFLSGNNLSRFEMSLRLNFGAEIELEVAGNHFAFRADMQQIYLVGWSEVVGAVGVWAVSCLIFALFLGEICWRSWVVVR